MATDTLLAGHIPGHHVPLIYCLFKKIKYLDTTGFEEMEKRKVSKIVASNYKALAEGQGRRIEILGT